MKPSNLLLVTAMRRLVVLLCGAAVTLYVGVAYHYYEQERRARNGSIENESDARHPEALLAAARSRLDEHRYGSDGRGLLRRAILETPSFYEGPFLLAAYRENRLDPPEEVREAYESAIARYPANGRLHLAYGAWLLRARSDLRAWIAGDGPGRLADPLGRAEPALERAMELEPDLTWRALDALADERVPPERWVPLVPEEPLARTHLVDALFRAGHAELGWAWLEEDLAGSDPAKLARLVRRGLEHGRPELALQAAERWLEAVEARSGAGPELVEPALWRARAHLALGGPERAHASVSGTLEALDEKLGVASRPSLELLCSMGEELLRQRQWMSAEAWFSEAASRSPSFVPALYGLGRSLRAAGDPSGAAGYYEQVLRREPDHRGARSELEAVLVELSRR